MNEIYRGKFYLLATASEEILKITKGFNEVSFALKAKPDTLPESVKFDAREIDLEKIALILSRKEILSNFFHLNYLKEVTDNVEK